MRLHGFSRVVAEIQEGIVEIAYNSVSLLGCSGMIVVRVVKMLLVRPSWSHESLWIRNMILEVVLCHNRLQRVSVTESSFE